MAQHTGSHSIRSDLAIVGVVLALILGAGLGATFGHPFNRRPIPDEQASTEKDRSDGASFMIPQAKPAAEEPPKSRTKSPSQELRTGAIARGFVQAAASARTLDRYWQLRLAGDRLGYQRMESQGQVVDTSDEDVFRILSVREPGRYESEYLMEVRFIEGQLRGKSAWVKATQGSLTILEPLPND